MEPWQASYASMKLSPQVPPLPDTPSCGSDTRWDLENMLPLALIRQHTKTDDVPHVTNEQINLYRKAAVEAAEHYTGFLLAGQKVIQEPVATKPKKSIRTSYIHTLLWPTADGVVYFYGSPNGLGNAVFNVAPGSRKITIPVDRFVIDARSCCDPCANQNTVNFGMRLMYRAGFSKCEEIPAGILVGMLKYIAWHVSNPGDEIMTVRNRVDDASPLNGTNNAAWASGALELWRQYVLDAI